MSVALCWFRRDLRIADHPALCAAAAQGRVVPVYVIDPVLWKSAGASRKNFLIATLRSLGRSIGGRMVIRHGDPVSCVAQLASEVGAREVFVTRDHTPFGHRRDAAVSAQLSWDGVRLIGVGTNYAVAPGAVRKATGDPYSVFTPFSRAWQAQCADRPLAIPEVDWLGDPEVHCQGYPPLVPEGVASPDAGEEAAHHRWLTFRTDSLDGYDEHRDNPGADRTSRLGADLRFGALHPRQLLAELGDSAAHHTFRKELAWREFYADVLWHHPESAWNDLRPALANLPYDTDARAHNRFATWCAGQTGYPLVDAGMRQLLAEGFMHNRVRMVAASFLVKDLHLPWQWGARHFMRHLIDGDIASNNHGWQWVAGTGTDAAPYFRIFNPTSQSERFDPDGVYIRRYVTELANAPTRTVHAPASSTRGLPLGYVPPMVDHAEERIEALRRYRVATSNKEMVAR